MGIAMHDLEVIDWNGRSHGHREGQRAKHKGQLQDAVR